MVMSMLNAMRPIGAIYRDVCREFNVTSQTVRRDLRWAGEQVAKDLDAASQADPVKTYHRLDAIEEMAAHAGAAAPVFSPDGEPLMGRTDDGEEFPVLMADAKLLAVSIKACQAKMGLMGWRDSIKWKRSLQHQQTELAKAKTDLAKEQLRIAERDRQIEEERKAMLAAKTTRGGIPVLQRPDQDVLNRMSRFLLTGKTELEGWILSHSQPEETTDVQDGGEDGGESDDLRGAHEHRDELHGDDAADAPGGQGERGDPGGNGSG
jgi:hypothetical protein